MAQVSLQINGYGYFLACGDGEEDHLLALAADLDRRIDDIKAATGPSGEARLLLMAALMLGMISLCRHESEYRRPPGLRPACGPGFRRASGPAVRRCPPWPRSPESTG